MSHFRPLWFSLRGWLPASWNSLSSSFACSLHFLFDLLLPLSLSLSPSLLFLYMFAGSPSLSLYVLLTCSLFLPQTSWQLVLPSFMSPQADWADEDDRERGGGVCVGDFWGRMDELWGWWVGGGALSDRWTCLRDSHPPTPPLTHTHTCIHTYHSPPPPPALPRVERPGLGRPDKATGTSGGGGSVANVTVWLTLLTPCCSQISLILILFDKWFSRPVWHRFSYTQTADSKCIISQLIDQNISL